MGVIKCQQINFDKGVDKFDCYSIKCSREERGQTEHWFILFI